MSAYLYDTAEAALCADSDHARWLNERKAASNPERAAAELLLEAIDEPETAALRHTARVQLMIRDGDLAKAQSMHEAYAVAAGERGALGEGTADGLDIHVARILLEAEAWRCREVDQDESLD